MGVLFFCLSRLALHFAFIGTVVSGTFYCKKSEGNSRELDVEIHYSVRKSEDAPPSEVVVQIYKVR